MGLRSRVRRGFALGVRETYIASRLIIGVTAVTIWVIGVVNLLTKSP